MDGNKDKGGETQPGLSQGQHYHEIKKIDNFPYFKGKYTYYLGLNKLSDRLPEEKAALNGYKRKIKDTSKIEFFKMHKTTNLQAPQKIDWRDLGGVTEVNYDNNAHQTCNP